MRKALPYILSLLLLVAIALLIATGTKKSGHNFDDRITLNRKDKIPYGMYVAYENLKYLFPQAGIYINKREPGYWDSLSTFDGGQALIIVTPQFMASSSEMKRIITFVEHGNDVLISTMRVSGSVEDMLGCKMNDIFISGFTGDSLSVALNKPPFEGTNIYQYPGKSISPSFEGTNSKAINVIGSYNKGASNFIHLKASKGNLYVQITPMAFTNYFLLHKKNIGYYEKAFSVINPAATRVVWDEYYLNKKYDDSQDDNATNWLGTLFHHKALRAGLLTAIFILLAYALFEMRRKQRYIPVINPPKNDSLEFVKTIGRLYYDKGDHRNLCIKMVAYFMEYVRNKYKLATGTLNDEFVKKLSFKTGVKEDELGEIVSFINQLQNSPVSQQQLTTFYRQLESFYKKA